MSDQDDWEEIWNARAEALSRSLGPCHDQVFHALHPFALGGQADVLAFYQHISGVAYVTAELTGKPDAGYADYELIICERSASTWAPDVMSQLAPYTQKTRIRAGESMDIDSASPADSLIKAFVFDTYGKFAMFGREYDLRLCLGITKAELKFKMERGSDKLLALLKSHGVYPYTDLCRESIPLDG